MPQYLFYAYLLLIAASLSTTICIVAWKRRGARGSLPLLFLSLGLVWWSFTYALHWLTLLQRYEVFWLDATYLGVVTVPTTFLAFALTYTQRVNRFSLRQCIGLAIEPTLTLLLLWTDPLHGLFFGGVRPAQSSAIFSGGIWFWANVIYSYLLVALALVLLIQNFLRAPRFQRNQTSMILAGAVVPLIGDVIGLLKISPFPDLDITPFAFTLTALAFAGGLFMFQLLDIVPIARSLVIESMNDGIVVLDAQNRIVDINKQACQLMSIPHLEPLGQPAHEVIPHWQEIALRYREGIKHEDILTFDSQPPCFLELHITPITDHKKARLGWLAILRDITEKVQAEEQLRQMNTDLQKTIDEIEGLQAELREQAVRDPLTGLYNRRYMEEILHQELAYALRNDQPVCLIYLDIDFFKLINDRFGHEGGDAVLQGLGNLLRDLARPGDLPCRVGGDEFVVILPGATQEIAWQRAERLRSEFSNRFQVFQGRRIDAALSLGIGAYPVHGQQSDELLRAADQAMYQAKRNGRNQIAVYQR